MLARVGVDRQAGTGSGRRRPAQYGETDDEVVGSGIIVALTLINNLEVNEQILYARMIDVEQTTLIT